MYKYFFKIKYIIVFFTLMIVSESILAETKMHMVKKGETFAIIASQYGLTQSELLQANPKVKQCFTGLKLVIPEVSPISKNTEIVSTNTNFSYDLKSNSTLTDNKTNSSLSDNTPKQNTTQSKTSNVPKNEKKNKSGFMDVLDKIGKVAEALSATAQEMSTSMTTNSNSVTSFTSDNQNTTHTIVTSHGTLHLTDKQLNDRINQLETRKLNLQREFNQLKIQNDQAFKQGSMAMARNRVVSAGDKYFNQSLEISKRMSEIQMSVQSIDKELEQLKGLDENGNTIHQSSKSPVFKSECVQCHGLKTCTHCAGRGQKQYTNMYGTSYKDCSYCRGKGICSYCHGKGYTTTTVGY